MAFEGKQYALNVADDIDAFLETLGADDNVKAGIKALITKIVSGINPTLALEANEDGTYTLKFTSALFSKDYTFPLGEPVENERADGTTVSSTITLEDDVLTQVHELSTGKTFTAVGTFTEDDLTLVVSQDEETVLFKAHFVAE